MSGWVPKSALIIVLTLASACKANILTLQRTPQNFDSAGEIFRILQPESGSSVATPTPTVLWEAGSDAMVYNLILATDKRCEESLYNYRNLTQSAVTLPELANGSYWLCLSGKDATSDLDVNLAVNSPLMFEVVIEERGANDHPSLIDFSSSSEHAFVGIVVDTGAVKSLAYKVGLAIETDCSSDSGYSTEISASEFKGVDTRSMDDGDYVLCVHIREMTEASAPSEQVFEYLWTKDTTPPHVDAGVTIVTSAPTAIQAIVEDASPVSYRWSQVSGPGTVTFSSKSVKNPTVWADEYGHYVLRLTVKDASNNIGSDTIRFTWGLWCTGENLTSALTDTGLGTSEDPYRICTIEQLQAIEQNLAANYVLEADIDATTTMSWNGGEGFVPIGMASGCGESGFTGVFDGNGYSIHQLTIQRPGEDNVGLFACANGALIENAHLKEAAISGQSHVGAIVGRAINSSIQQVFVTGTITGNAGAVGGVAGDLSGSSSVLSDVYTQGVVSGLSEVGGIVGVLKDGAAASELSARVSVLAESHVGGAVGTCEGSVTKSNALGSVTCELEYGGGLLGSAASCEVRDSYAKGAISICPGGYSGGLVGGATESVFRRVFATGSVTGTGSISGGLFGLLSASVLEASFATSDVIAGVAYATGGIVGYAIDSQISDVWAGGRVESAQVSGGSNGAGGVFGYARNSFIRNSYSIGSVTSTGTAIGGFGGILWSIDPDGASHVDASFSTGRVSAASFRGGFLGYYLTENGADTATVGATCRWDRGLSNQSSMCSGYLTGEGCDNANYVTGNLSYWYTKGSVPLNEWDFDNVWKEADATFPLLKWQAEHKIFVSSETYPGNLGGLSGADERCQSLAEEAELAGMWQAVLSSSTVNASKRLHITGPIYNARGALVSRHHGDLWSEDLQASIVFDERGNDLSGTENLDVWTGSNDSGAFNASGSCLDWLSTDAGELAQTGALNAADSTWISQGASSCQNLRRLYCVSVAIE